jgi:hypothetical protein
MYKECSGSPSSGQRRFVSGDPEDYITDYGASLGKTNYKHPLPGHRKLENGENLFRYKVICIIGSVASDYNTLTRVEVKESTTQPIELVCCCMVETTLQQGKKKAGTNS